MCRKQHRPSKCQRRRLRRREFQRRRTEEQRRNRPRFAEQSCQVEVQNIRPELVSIGAVRRPNDNGMSAALLYGGVPLQIVTTVSIPAWAGREINTKSQGFKVKLDQGDPHLFKAVQRAYVLSKKKFEMGMLTKPSLE